MKFYTKPWKHQTEALDYLYPRSFGALYTDMGSGKTKIMIDLIVNRGFKRVLIVAPKKVCRVWAPQFLVHAPNEPYTVLDLSEMSGDKKVLTLRQSTKIAQQVLIINYDSVWREPFKKMILKYKLDAVICDESHRIKTPGSKASRFLTQLGKRVPNRFLMSGTPLAQSPLDIYGQYRFLNPAIFGTNFGKFQDSYANMVLTQGGFKMIDKNNPYKNLDNLQAKMFSCAFKTDVVQNLPETQDIRVEFDLSPKAQKYYKEFKKEGALIFKKGNVEAGNILAVMLRLQQLTSGYLPLDTGEIEDIDDSRRAALRDLLEDLPPEEPVVIFAKYTRDIKNIRRVVNDMGRTSSEVSGKRDTLNNWLAGKTTVLVVQISAGAEGIDLTRARYCVYYTLDYSLSRYLQSRKRVHRPGQTRPVVYYTLIAKLKSGKTIDEQIAESLANNQEITDKIMLNLEF